MLPAPKVTIVTPVFNLAPFLTDAIESVRAQTFDDWEHILVDDCSTDGSWDLLQTYAARDERIRPIRLAENRGAAEARNAALKEARGRYIAFLDGDDMWEPVKLETQLAFMEAHSSQFSYTDYVEVDEDNGEVVGIVESPDRVTGADIIKSNQICCSTAMYDTRDVGVVFMPLIRKRQDWGLWIELINRGLEARNVGQRLLRYRVRPGSVSSNKFVAMMYVWKFYRRVLKLGLVASGWRTANYAVINMRKYKKKKLSAKLASSDC